MHRFVLVSTFSLVVTGLLGCSKPPPKVPRFPQAQAQEPPWLLLRVDAVRVTPYHPGTTMSWDGPAPAPNDSAECGLLGLGLGLINPIAGKGADLLCRIDKRSPQLEQDPSAPDLAVVVSAGAGATYMTYTARDTFFHVFRSEFVVPTGAIPREGLSLTVIDRDRPSHEVLGNVRVGRQQLVGTALSSQPLLVLSDPAGGLLRLEVVISPYAGGTEGVDATMDARDGTMSAPLRSLRAGEVVTIAATGSYQVGGFYNALLDPRGYPGGGPREYNFEAEPFRSAPHGVALAQLGRGDAKEGLLVAPCTTVVSQVGGPLLLGVNDNDPNNNSGQLQFSVRVRPATPSEWMARQIGVCALW